MARERAMASAELTVGELKCVMIDGIPICLVHAENGKFYALDDTCSHERASLSDGWTSGTEIECPLHNAMFDLRTGEATSLPATEPVRTYPVSEEDGELYVDVPENP